MSKSELLDQLVEWRHYLHMHPETGFEEVNTSKFIAEKMKEMGYDVHTGIGKTGVVASLTSGNSDKAIGIRADMDALNIVEQTGLPYASKTHGKMHACGHDGHVTTALGAAKILAESKDFNGTVRFIFQPAEEHGKGALAMLEDGLFERFPIDEFYGLHNMPNLPEGEIHSKVGPIMGSEDNFEIKIKGIGGHASAPQMGKDPLVTASEIILALQTIVARNVDPVDTAVVSCTEIHTDGIINAIPSNVVITGDTRSYRPEVQALLEKRMRLICEKICEANEVECEFSYSNSFIPTVNWEKCHNVAVQAAKNVLGEDKVNPNANPTMVSEDFGHFLDIMPGCFVFLGGQREGVEPYPLHHAKFDYKEENLLRGAEFFAEIVRLTLK
ncbi:M20 aminoacylase family protein [Bacillus chungangensis]|uniref:Hippurate hydrolase n=1 Tax=Bacillus chungangensis TaxID=587633 RepID=A0ABT9WXX0_9BACI|nr:M20 aminoacylase family protein [Bacillus chungangensis]MDQ0178094.1 hippurate hydrolase [Bacillus chungangensis]